jgi:hypothetical protein
MCESDSRLRGEVGSPQAIRVRGRLRMGGASDKKAVGVLNHRRRVVFLGAPSPGAHAFHARTPTSPRARGEVKRRCTARIFSPDSRAGPRKAGKGARRAPDGPLMPHVPLGLTRLVGIALLGSSGQGCRG